MGLGWDPSAKISPQTGPLHPSVRHMVIFAMIGSNSNSKVNYFFKAPKILFGAASVNQQTVADV